MLSERKTCSRLEEKRRKREVAVGKRKQKQREDLLEKENIRKKIKQGKHSQPDGPT